MIVITLARKPPQGTVGANVGAFGTGGLNIDKTRIEGPAWKWGTQTDLRGGGYGTQRPSEGFVLNRNVESDPKGRWPANVAFQQQAIGVLNSQGGTTKSGVRSPTGRSIYPTAEQGKAMCWNANSVIDSTTRGFQDEGFVSRFFKQIK